MARPKKQPHERRSAKLPPIRLTEAELADLHLQAERAGLSVTELVRQRATSGKVTPKRGLVDAQLLSELNRVGVNLNQIARQVNRGRDHDPHHLDHVLGQIVAVLEQVGRRT
jgi:hypothetical protein